jgi:hypothetical protein
VWKLSLRPSQGAWREGVPSSAAAASGADTAEAVPESLTLSDLKIGQQVRTHVEIALHWLKSCWYALAVWKC